MKVLAILFLGITLLCLGVAAEDNLRGPLLNAMQGPSGRQVSVPVTSLERFDSSVISIISFAFAISAPIGVISLIIALLFKFVS